MTKCCFAITIWRKCRRNKRLNQVAVAPGKLVFLAVPGPEIDWKVVKSMSLPSPQQLLKVNHRNHQHL